MQLQASVEEPTAGSPSVLEIESRPSQSDSDMEELNNPKLLRSIAKKYGIKRTKSLVAAYNATTNKDERGVILHWLRRYDERRDDCLKPKCMLEYAELAKIAPRSTHDKEVLKNLVCALGSCLRQRKLPAKNLAMALYRTLIHVDSSAFDVADLVVVARKLLTSLCPEPKLSRENFAEHEATFYALQQTFFLLNKTSHSNIDKEEKQEFRRVIAEKQSEMGLSCKYYPVSFHFKALRQAVERLDLNDTSSSLTQAMQCAALGVCGILHVLHCVRNLASCDIEPTAILDSNRRLRGMAAGVGMSKRPWFDVFQNLMAARLDASKDEAIFELFESRFTAAMEYQRTMRKGKDLKALRFGIIQELGTLAAEGSIERIREEAIKKLLDVTTQEAVDEGWIGDADVLAAFLDVLNKIHKTNQGGDERLKEAIQVLYQSCMSRAKQVLAEWLGGRILEDKIRTRSPQRPVAEHSELFIEIGRDVGYIPLAIVDSNKEELRKGYTHDDFATVASLFVKGSRKHVKEMKQHVVISEEIVEEQEFTSEDATESVIRGEKGRKEGSSNRKRDQAKEYYEQKTVVTKPIALEDLFKKRSLKPEAVESEIRRVLLYGNPGSGKTCITKVIAHKWALGEMAQEFDAVYVVPVRVLNSTEHKRQPWATLEGAISLICFPKRKNTSDYEDLVVQIEDELDSPSTLLVVDGLDEANDHSREILSNIWGRSCKVLLLSRPYNMRNIETRVDIQVECLGFDDTQLRDYIKSELADDEAPRLIHSLESSTAMWEMAHIPVTAHILCSLSKEHGTAIQEEGRKASAFQVYNDMANYIWKRFEEKPSARNVKKFELFGDLEKIAFEALQNGAILIHERSVMEHATSKNAVRTFKESGLLLLVLEGQEYQFPHLTFQEYFAGRYVARSLKQKGSDEERRVLDFVREGKYNKKHALTLSFAMHTFARGRSRHALKEMLSIVDEQPVDVLGLHHFLLRMQVLEATMEEADDLDALTKDKQAIKIAEGARRLLEGTIENALIRKIVVEKFEQCYCILEKFPKILNDTVNETKTLLAGPRSLTWEERDKIKDVFKLTKHSSKHVGEIGSFLQQNTTLMDWHYPHLGMSKLLDIAKGTPQLVGDMVPMLEKGCREDSSDMRRSAILAIKSTVKAAPELWDDLLPMLQKGCDDEASTVRRSAMQVTCDISYFAPELWDDLLPMLQKGCGDEASNVRWSAIHVIGRIFYWAPKFWGNVLLPMLQKACSDEASDVRSSAISAIGWIAKSAPDIWSDLLLPLLQKGCNDEASEVRSSAILAIGGVGKSTPKLWGDLLPMLQKGSGDEDSLVRNGAMQVIGDIAGTAPQLWSDLLPMLQKGCGDETSGSRRRTMSAIGGIAKSAPELWEDLLPLLQKGFGDEDSLVRNGAMQVIGDIAGTAPQLWGDLLPMLEKGCSDETSGSRRNAMQVIGDIAKAVPDLWGDLLPMLQKGFGDEDSNVRRNAMHAIGDVAKAAPHLSGDLLSTLQKGCNDEDIVLRNYVMQAIGDIAKAVPDIWSDLLPMLEKGCCDEGFHVRKSAMESIGDIAKVVPDIWSDLLPMLQKGCGDEAFSVRWSAIHTIGLIANGGPKLRGDLLPMLQKACTDEASDVRSSAMHAIGEIIKAAPHLSGDLLPTVEKGCSDKAANMHKAATKILNTIKVDETILSTVFSSSLYERVPFLLLLRNAFTLDYSSQSEEVSLVFHTTSSERIGLWDKKDIDRFVRRFKEEFDQSFLGLSGYLQTKN